MGHYQHILLFIFAFSTVNSKYVEMTAFELCISVFRDLPTEPQPLPYIL